LELLFRGELNFFSYLFFGIESLQRADVDASWEILNVFNYISLVGFYCLIFSFIWFLLVLLEAFLLKRTKKNLVIFLNWLRFDYNQSKLDFIISRVFSFYLLVYFMSSDYKRKLFAINYVYNSVFNFFDNPHVS
jgi:hypothetical protein